MLKNIKMNRLSGMTTAGLILVLLANYSISQQKITDKIKIIDCYYENASPLIWDALGDTAIKITFLYDYERGNINRQSTHINFKIEAEAGTEINLILSGFEDIYNGTMKTSYGRSTNHNISCYFSEDYHNWTGVETTTVAGSNFDLQVKYRMKTNMVFVAKLPVYSLVHLDNFIKNIVQHEFVKIIPIGFTVEKRPLEIIRIGKPDAAHRILVRARAHPWEPGGNYVVEGIVSEFIEAQSKPDSPVKNISWYIMPMANKDGVFRGMTRFNVKGIDLNRGWGIVPDSLLEPENYALEMFVRKLIGENKKPDFFMDFHNDNYGNIHIFEPRTKDPEYEQNIEKLFKLMKEKTWFSGNLQKVSATDPRRYYSSAGLYERYGINGCVMELNSDWIEKPGKLPTIDDWRLLGRNLYNVFYEYFR